MDAHKFTEENFLKKLQERGHKPTKERGLIFKEVLKMPHHFNADDLAIKVHKRDQNVSRATIYRTLPILIELGILREVVFSDKHHNYECMLGREHHEHLICIRCRKIIEFSDERLEIPLDEACERYQFKAVAHKTEVTGYCKDCR
jgi:Fur family ferric uptake transcriptional regulator